MEAKEDEKELNQNDNQSNVIHQNKIVKKQKTEQQAEQKFEVEKIVKHVVLNNEKVLYEVAYKNFPNAEDNRWMNEQSLMESAVILFKYCEDNDLEISEQLLAAKNEQEGMEVDIDYWVEDIIGHENEPDGTIKYLVKYMGYNNPNDNTYELEEDLKASSVCLRNYKLKVGLPISKELHERMLEQAKLKVCSNNRFPQKKPKRSKDSNKGEKTTEKKDSTVDSVEKLTPQMTLFTDEEDSE